MKIERGEVEEEESTRLTPDVEDPVVAFLARLAREEPKERYAQKYKAFVPKDGKDLGNNLRYA